MKYISGILLLIACSSFTGTINYPVARLYAYRQKVSAGANSVIDKKSKQATQNYIYLLVKQNRTILIDKVWIDGAAVNFTTQEVGSPVTVDAGVSLSGRGTIQQLVPQTTHRLLQVITEYNANAEAKLLPKQYKKYQLLIQYKEDSSVFYLGTKNWKTIAAKTNQ